MMGMFLIQFWGDNLSWYVWFSHVYDCFWVYKHFKLQKQYHFKVHFRRRTNGPFAKYPTQKLCLFLRHVLVDCHSLSQLILVLKIGQTSLLDGFLYLIYFFYFPYEKNNYILSLNNYSNLPNFLNKHYKLFHNGLIMNKYKVHNIINLQR